jgi:hypothetical protein
VNRTRRQFFLSAHRGEIPLSTRTGVAEGGDEPGPLVEPNGLEGDPDVLRSPPQLGMSGGRVRRVQRPFIGWQSDVGNFVKVIGHPSRLTFTIC